MHHNLILVVMIAVLAVGVACSQQSADQASGEGAAADGNVLLAEWTGPYGGVPAFDKMDLADLKPALEIGMETNLAEIDVIANNPEPPTFENTILAMERSGAELDRVFPYFGIWSGNISTPEFREIQAEMAPRLADMTNRISLDL